MITVKRILATILVAYILQILMTFLFISSINITKKKSKRIIKLVNFKGSNTNLDKVVEAIEVDENVENQEDLDFGEDFKMPCYKVHTDAISAIRRAKTPFCKEKIANISCSIETSDYYPRYLPHTCPNNGLKYGKYLGCYAYRYKARLMPDYNITYSDRNSRINCMDRCVLGGFPYAGVQNGTKCYCGNNKPPQSSKISESSCDMRCPGALDELCGGRLSMNIFETGVAKFIPRNQTVPSKTKYKEPVRIVFLLTLSGRALRQVLRLINVLYRRYHYFYIHVDSRQDYLHRKLSVLETQLPNIKLATKRYPTMWAGTTLVKMLISSMREFSTLGWEWDFVTNLSESNFLIKPLDDLENFLSVNKGLNFLKAHGVDFEKHVRRQGLNRSFVECEERMWLIGDKILPKGMITDGGSDWMTLSKEFVSYITGPKDELLSGLDKIYDHTIFSAESYFHTVLRNTKFCKTYVDNNLHFTNWNRTIGCKCQYKHIVDWCGCSPNDFKTKDWLKIVNAKKRQVFFARKFEPIINQEIINKVESSLGTNYQTLQDNLEGYWQNIFDIEDTVSTKDDLLMSHAKSITRNNANILNKNGCDTVPGDVKEINLYNKADAYKGNLVLHRANFEGKNIILETLYKPNKLFNWEISSEHNGTIKMFKVRSEYDQKEIIFRNFANILGPYTEPVLVYDITPNFENKKENYIIRWIDPVGRVAKVNNILVHNKNHSNFINSNLTSPILPGVWKVWLFKDNHLIVQIKFLITPLEFHSRHLLSMENAHKINGGSKSSYQNYDNFDSQKYVTFPKKYNEKLTHGVYHSNAKKTNDDLRDWIDKLSIQFYEVIKSCVSQTSDIKEPMRCGARIIDICELTDWSSLSFDPKGSIGKLNKITGKLERVRRVYDKTI